MPATIYSDRNHEFPASLLSIDDNLMLLADGINPVLQWNGKDAAAATAGVAAPTAALVLADGGAGAITTTNCVAYCRFVAAGPLYSDLTPVSNALTITGKRINYSNIPVPTDPKVVRKEIFRTLSGGGATLYLDQAITTLSATTASSNDDDSVISLRDAIVLTDADGNDIYNVNGVPPDYKAVLANHLGRVFGAVEAVYTTGHVEVTNGGTTVIGVGTNWTQPMTTRYLYVIGGLKPYRIGSIGAVVNGRQTMTLGETYTGPTDLFGVYAIRPDPIHRRTIMFSEPFEPQSWDATNALAIQETKDELTALISQGAYLYVIERKHIHRLAYDDSPVTDGAVFLMAKRGVINQRSWVSVGENIFMLDEQGVHKYDGNRQTEQISSPIQDLWRTDGTGYRINWRARRWFHAVHYPSQEVIRWFVALSGSRYPRHALAYHHGIDRWWIEEYRVPISSSVEARLNVPRVLAGSSYTNVLGIDVGTLDAVDPLRVDRGQATAATLLSLSDDLAAFEQASVGAPLAIVKGKGRGQIRDIVAVSATRLDIKTPWRELPDTTSVYQIGAFGWEWASGHMRWAPGNDNNRYLEAIFEPVPSENQMDLERYVDFAADPAEWKYDIEQEGIVVAAGETAIQVNLTHPLGRVLQRLEDGQDQSAAGFRFVRIRASGYSGKDAVRIHEINVGGAQ